MDQNIQIFRPDYKLERSHLFSFLNDFVDKNIPDHPTHGQKKYLIEIQKVVDREIKRIDILTEDLSEYLSSEADMKMMHYIEVNTLRYRELLAEAIDELIVNFRPSTSLDDIQTTEEILNQQRQLNMENSDLNNSPNNPNNKLPSLLKRQFELYIIRGPNSKNNMMAIRSLQSDMIGSLVTLKGIVVRTSDVKSCMTIACYVCDACGFENYQTVNGQFFTPLAECSSSYCKTNKTKGKIVLNTGVSLFTPYQDIVIQQTSDQTPVGNIPQTFRVVSRGVNVRQCSPGDKVMIQGVLLPDQIDTFSGRGKMIVDTLVEAFTISKEKQKYIDLNITEDTEDKIFKLQSCMEPFELYNLLSKSIAPEIFGLEDVKKALLLLMIGGSTLERSDLRIRGDINIALIGDPGIAKSQLLKSIANLSPRGIYTTGQGSSGVGLTAAVVKDELTGEISLEGGALVLSDMGVCCIDEFDKMDENDRTSIHEVMEQQTVSIAKAGITTTLNARTSILAAANPLYGRYNQSKTPNENINLPAALLSRFDLIFILLDKHDRERDTLLAKHITYVHKHKEAPQIDFEPIEPGLLRAFIAISQRYEPTIDEELHRELVEQYVSKRSLQYKDENKGQSYVTPRTLLGIVRLSQAMAKLRFSNEVNHDDIEEALRLMDIAQESVADSMEDQASDFQILKTDHKSACYQILKDMLKYDKNKKEYLPVKMHDLEKRVLAKGFLHENLVGCLAVYEKLDIIKISQNRDYVYYFGMKPR